jgi:hypothetical protein
MDVDESINGYLAVPEAFRRRRDTIREVVVDEISTSGRRISQKCHGNWGGPEAERPHSTTPRVPWFGYFFVQEEMVCGVGLF